MKKKLLIMILMAFLAGKAFTQDGYTVKIGGNYSSFRGQESELDLGFALGIGREWKISKRTGLALELMYTAKKAALRNKTVGSYLWGIGDGYDIYCDVRYFEVPLVWTYYWPVRKALSIKLHAGPSLELAINDRSKRVHLYNITFPQPGFKYDYTFPQEPYPLWRGSSGFNLNGGVAIGLSSFTVELRYSRALYDIDVISGIAMNEKLDCGAGKPHKRSTSIPSLTELSQSVSAFHSIAATSRRAQPCVSHDLQFARPADSKLV